MAIPSQLTPEEPEETGAELLLEEELPVEAELLLLEDELPLLDELLVAAFLVPTVMTLAVAGVTLVRDTSFLAVSVPLTVVTW